MPTFRIKTKDGRTFDVKAADEAAARNVFESANVGSLGVGQSMTPEADPVVARGELLPLTRTQSGKIRPGLPGGLDRARQTVVDVLEGRTDPSEIDPQALIDLGLTATPGGAATSRAFKAPTGAPPVSPGQEAVEAGARIGVDLPRAAATDASSVQQIGQAVTRVPIAGEPLRSAAETAAGQIDEAALRASQVGTGNVEKAGGGIREDVASFISTRQDEVGQKFDDVSKVVSNTIRTPLKRTRRAAAAIAEERAAGKLPASNAIARVQAAIAEPGGLTFDGIKTLRTAIREELKAPNLLPAGTSESELKRLMTALTTDLESAATRAGGKKGRAAFQVANAFAKTAADERRALAKALGTNQSDEQIFNRVLGAAGVTGRADAATLRRVMSALTDESKDEFLSAFIARVGRDPDGKFSTERFLGPQGINKLSDDAKGILFAGREGLAKDLQDLATISRRYRKLRDFANPSGTTQQAVTIGGILGLGADPVTTISAIVGGNILARLLAKPASAKGIAKYAKAYDNFIRRPSAATRRELQRVIPRVAAILAVSGAERLDEDEVAKTLATPALAGAGPQTPKPRPGVPRGFEPAARTAPAPGLSPSLGRSALRPGVT